MLSDSYDMLMTSSHQIRQRSDFSVVSIGAELVIKALKLLLLNLAFVLAIATQHLPSRL